MLLNALLGKKTIMPTVETALPGRAEPLATEREHYVTGRPLKGPYPDGLRTIYLGMGCFWGAERLFWTMEGVWVTAVGYQGGITPNPTYEETCTGLTGHAEVVKVVYDPEKVTLEKLLKRFFEEHDPTQGMRQGNDIGTTYRSVIYTESADDLDAARRMAEAFARALVEAGAPRSVTTEIAEAGPFYYAEDYHQQYLAKNPGGYCGLRGTGVSCPIV
ncbi:peptide-methionine (S)-S-oxide reductase MsrA [Allorhizobium sp. BGMRC 0089]|uniref:peptide-methionine (S)-S-oxide reductase MsrA n=1 Tax=Allorhizobium sonneratiae TaxID=2934936 RepID=UPI002033A707|nr:peptide-methionine (S)-S-oxide reductase MsrA [Allorhizobium sonneratiae]MCM2291697.1 peptide-methionine (S)-S-oxide reductase MsrA [Allorhizobium sonneratiae]